MFAALAVKASLQQAPDPDRGMLTDISVVSTFLPYCDAVFIDRRCSELYSAADSELNFEFDVRVFTPRNRDQMLIWLDDVEAQVGEEHRRLVNDVYGEAWLTPYREIFTAEAEQD